MSLFCQGFLRIQENIKIPFIFLPSLEKNISYLLILETALDMKWIVQYCWYIL